jgi:hypothetical protein
MRYMMRKLIAPVLALAAVLFASVAGADQLNINAQTGTTYTFLNTDCSKLVTFSNSAAMAATLPQASSASGGGAGAGTFMPPCAIGVYNASTATAGIVTITPTTSTIDGQAAISLAPGQGAIIVSDGTNYQTERTSSNVGRVNGTALPSSGRLYSQIGPIESFGTTTAGVTVATYLVPANTFDVAGRTLHIHADFHTLTSTDSKSIACGFGNNVVTATYAVTSVTGTAYGTCDMIVVQGTTANTQMYAGRIILGTTPLVATYSSATTNSATTANAVNAMVEIAVPTAAGDLLVDDVEITYDN